MDGGVHRRRDILRALGAGAACAAALAGCAGAEGFGRYRRLPTREVRHTVLIDALKRENHEVFGSGVNETHSRLLGQLLVVPGG
ncbi:MAG: hypothetical protein FJ311_03855, partial [Rhodospirillales bacterium]|nr:hypothetical protein [Rhodospirillales bacterium]